MDSRVWDSHLFGMEETSDCPNERISAEYHSDGDNCGTSLECWGGKELKSSISYTDVSVDSAYTSSNKLSSAYRSFHQARSFTDSGKEHSLDTYPSETSCDEELFDLDETEDSFKPSFLMDEEECGAEAKKVLECIDLTGEEKNVLQQLMDKEEWKAEAKVLECIDLTEEAKNVLQQLMDEEECEAEAKKVLECIDHTEEEKNKQYLTQKEISTPKVSSIKDQRSYFHRNYTFLIEDLEPSCKLMDEMISSQCRDKFFSERIREAPTRRRRADILIKYAARYLDKDSFESLLEKTGHAHIIKKLQKGSTQEACTPRASDFEDRSHLLCNKEFEDLLADEIEPRDIIDKLVEHEVLTLEDHEDLLVTDYRPKRVESLIKYINRNPKKNFIYFFKLLKEHYPHLIDQFDTWNNAACSERTSDFDIKIRTGGWRVPQSVATDKCAEIKFHVKMSPPSADVEMRVVEESETNMEVEYNMKLLDLQYESMHLGSIVIVHKQLTDQVIQKLQEACSTGEVKKYIKSLFSAKDVEQMKRDGVTFLVLRITAEKSQQVHSKLLRPVKITQEAICQNETYLDSMIPREHGSIADTTWMVTGHELQENASFLQDELEPKEYMKAFESILPQDVLRRLTADIDRRERAKMFLDEIVKKGQQAVDIFIHELERLGRHHVLNILRSSCTSASAVNVDRIAYQIRTSIVNNYKVFVAELEPKTFGTFFVERRAMDNALYENICQLPSRRNRAVAFLKWLLDEERPDAYIVFQKAVRIFSSETFVRMLETTEPQCTSEKSLPAVKETKDVAHTDVLLYMAKFRITFSNDTSSSTQNSVCKYQEPNETGISVDTDIQSYFSVEEQTESLLARGSGISKCGSSVSSWSIKRRHMHIWPDSTLYIPCERISSMLKVTEWLSKQDLAGIDLYSTSSADDHIFSNPRSDATSSASGQNQGEITKAATNDAIPDEGNQTSSETRMLIRMSNLKMTEEDENLLTNYNKHKMKLCKSERYSKPWSFCANTWHSTKIRQSHLKKRKAQYRLEQTVKRSTADWFSLPVESNVSNMNPHELKWTEVEEKLVTDDIPADCFNKQGLYLVSDCEHQVNIRRRGEDNEPRLLSAKPLHSTRNSKITVKEMVAQSLSGQSKANSTTSCFSPRLKLDFCFNNMLLHQGDSTATELGEKPDLLTKGKSAFCRFSSKIEKDCYNCVAKSRYGLTNRIRKPHKKQGSQGHKLGQRHTEISEDAPFFSRKPSYVTCQILNVDDMQASARDSQKKFTPGTFRKRLKANELHELGGQNTSA